VAESGIGSTIRSSLSSALRDPALAAAAKANNYAITTSTPSLAVTGRDSLETAGSLYLDYQTGGLSSFANGWQSKGSQGQLNSPYGKAAQIGAGLYGSGVFGNTPSGGVTAAENAWKSYAPSWMGGGSSTPPSDANPAGVVSDPSSPTGAYGMTGQPVPATTGGAASGAGAAAKGMSNAQKIALGLTGANALLGKKQALNPDLMAGATPAQTTSNSILDQFNKGQLNASDQYNIAKWSQDAKASKQQYYAQAGLADSSMAKQDIASVDAQAAAMRDQALNNMLQSGLNAAGIANSATGQAVQLQMQQDQQAQQAQQQFYQMLAFSMA